MSTTDRPACFDNHHKYVGKCPYCHMRLPGTAVPPSPATDECQCPHHPFGCYGHPDKCNCASPKRRQGHSKLVYDKEKRTIVPVDPHPPAAPADELVCPLCGAPDDAVACDNLKCPGTAVPRHAFDASRASPADDAAGLIERPWRCDLTGHPVGTDTVIIGAPPCDCQGCRAAAALSRLQARLAEATAQRDELRRNAAKWATRALKAEGLATSAATMREALTKIAAPYDGEGDTLLVPLQKIGAELRKRQQIARAALGGQHG
jgi:hypothetical protein